MDKIPLTPHEILTISDLTVESQYIARDAKIEVVEILPLANELVKVLQELPVNTVITSQKEAKAHGKLLAAYSIMLFELSRHKAVAILSAVAPIMISSGDKTKLYKATKLDLISRGDKSIEDLYKSAVNFTERYLQYRDYKCSAQKRSL